MFENNEVLADFGAYIHKPSLMRETITPGVMANMQGPDPEVAQRVGAEVKRLFRDTGAHRLILADENLIGLVDEIRVTGAMYPRALQRLGSLSDCLADYPVTEVQFSIRDYGNYLCSAYWESLRHSQFRTFREFLEKFEPTPRYWTRLVDQVRATFPKAKVSIWRYEEYRDIEFKVVNSLANADVYDRLTPRKVEYSYPSPSYRAIAALEALQSSMSRGEIKRIRRHIEPTLRSKEGGEDYDPLTRLERVFLRQKYAREIENLRLRNDITFID